MKKLLIFSFTFLLILFIPFEDANAQKYGPGPGHFFLNKGPSERVFGPYVTKRADGTQQRYYRIHYWTWKKVRITKQPVWHFYNKKWKVMQNVTGTYWTYSVDRKPKRVLKKPAVMVKY
jgi:hypothetical protein